MGDLWSESRGRRRRSAAVVSTGRIEARSVARRRRPTVRPGGGTLQLTPRRHVYETYWRFASERQRIFHQRARGESAPWTCDPILAEYKFCNVYRASDRVSQYLIREVIYGGDDHFPADVLFRVVLFRLFSRESTWEALRTGIGDISLGTFEDGVQRYAEVLDRVATRQAIYTGAFILCANNAYDQPNKHRNHLALLEDMFLRNRLSEQLLEVRSLREVYEILIAFPLIGPFMAYQLAIDLNYTDVLPFSENDFTVPGPGALRGMRKVFADPGDLDPASLVMLMVERQHEEFERLGLEFQDLFGRPLHAIDCQGLFCEVDKYSRVAFPELKSERVRIKSRFQPNPDRLLLFYPPSWGINDRLPADDGQASLLAEAL